MRLIKTFDKFFESISINDLDNIVLDLLQPLLDDYPDIEYRRSHISDIFVLAVFNSHKEEVCDFFKNNSYKFGIMNIGASMNYLKKRDPLALTFWYRDYEKERTQYVVSESYKLSKPELDLKIKELETLAKFFEIHSGSKININELQSLVIDYMQPLIDDLDIQEDISDSDVYFEACWYKINAICWEYRFGEVDTIKVSFYDNIDWEGIETLNNNQYKIAVYNFFHNNLDKLDIYGLKIVSNVRNINVDGYDSPPMEIFFQFK